MPILKTIVFLLLFGHTLCSANTIYRYQDSNGRWHFTDKKPLAQEATQLHYTAKEKANNKPSMQLKSMPGYWALAINNPLLTPIQVSVRLNSQSADTLTQTIEAQTEVVVANQVDPQAQYYFQYVLGKPDITPEAQEYYLPVHKAIGHVISQAFNGPFSHQQESSKYAVDIALPMGSQILAARDGLVVEVEDSFVMDGTNEYFADKANSVKVLHSDGTIAVYAHLMAGGAKVAVGDKVAAGDLLALSGSTGFSTGPHLHFVIWRNVGMKTTSVPFSFKEATGELWLPQQGMSLEPQ